MGGCFSKPARSLDETAQVPAVSGPVPSAGAEKPKQDAVQQTPQPASLPSSASVSAQLPPVVEGWTSADVLTWAAGLGLGPQAAGVLQVCGASVLAICIVAAAVCSLMQAMPDHSLCMLPSPCAGLLGPTVAAVDRQGALAARCAGCSRTTSVAYSTQKAARAARPTAATTQAATGVACRAG